MATDFGRETSCTTSLKTGRFVSGARLVGESYYRRLTTPRGMLRGGEEEKNFGKDLTALIGSVASATDEAALPGLIRNELMKDERSVTIDVTIVKTTAPNGLVSFEITIDAETTEGAVSLAIKASAVSVELLGITEES